jgi:hypothetical protein
MPYEQTHQEMIDEGLIVPHITEKNCTNTIKMFLEECIQCKRELDKKNVVVRLINFLIENIWFVKKNKKFRESTILKFKTLKHLHSEYEDMTESINELFSLLNVKKEISQEEICKKMEPIICENGESLYDNIVKCKIIIKNNMIYRSYDRCELIDIISKNEKLPSGEIIKHSNQEMITNPDTIFYELINIDDNIHVLVPYETQTFIKKYCSKKT